LGFFAGIAIGSALVSLARAFLPEAFLLETLNPLNVDLRALLVTSIGGVVATLAPGLLPAWLGTRTDSEASLHFNERHCTETRRARTATRALLVGEIALACTLLVGATLLVRSFLNLAGADRGLDVADALAARVSLPVSALPDRTARTLAARLMEDRVRELPGVEHVAWSYGLPPVGGAMSYGNWQSDEPGVAPVNLELGVDRYNVGPEFFALFDIPLLRGRTFTGADQRGAVVVGERLARALWPDLDPIGRSFTFGKERFDVIGLVREIHHPSVEPRQDRPEFYEPFAGVGSFATMSIRCRPTCPNTALVRQQIATAHPAVRVNGVDVLEDLYFEQLARPRAAAALGVVFSAVALLAAAGGLFSVLSYAVGRRRREFGIRTALGASSSHLRHLILRDGVSVAALGIGIGTVLAWSLNNAMRSLQYGVTTTDPLSWAIVVSVLALTAIGASWRPAQQATRADPARLVREE
jgi:predicted permease